MSQFDNVHIRRLDLTLLMVFEAAMESGKLTVAARRVGLTQSAVSHALKRLREVFDDELFVRTPRGVRPTQRALALRGPIAEALALIANAVKPPRFDPRKDKRLFRIAAPDYEVSLFAPALSAPLDEASACQVLFLPLVRREARDALKAGEVDVMLGYSWARDADCEAQQLYEEDYLVVARTGHPAFSAALDAPLYARLRHVLVSPGGSMDGIVDTVLAKAGLSRRVAVAVPYFLSALATVARSDLIATLPRRLVALHAESFGLQSAEPPLTVRRFPVSMVWSRRFGADPAILWLREQIMSSSREPLDQNYVCRHRTEPIDPLVS